MKILQTATIMIAIVLILVLVSSVAFSTFSFAVKTNSSSSTGAQHTTGITTNRTEPKFIPNEATNSKASSFRAAQNNATTTTLQTVSSECNAFEKGHVDFLWTHVYSPSRLKVQKDCITVTGVVNDNPSHEKDGDTHFVIRLDANQPNLSQPTNCQPTSSGCNYLIVEIICHNPIDSSRTASHRHMLQIR